MLGLSDRGAVRRLFGHVLEGNACEVLSAVQEQHVLGVEPLALMRGLLEICHAVTVAKTGREDEDPAKSAEESAQPGGWAAQMRFLKLHLLCKHLLKAPTDVAHAHMHIGP